MDWSDISAITPMDDAPSLAMDQQDDDDQAPPRRPPAVPPQQPQPVEAMHYPDNDPEDVEMPASSSSGQPPAPPAPPAAPVPISTDEPLQDPRGSSFPEMSIAVPTDPNPTLPQLRQAPPDVDMSDVAASSNNRPGPPGPPGAGAVIF